MSDATMISAGVMTLDEFMRRYDQEGPFEILDGEIVPKMPSVSGHTEIIKWFFVALLPYEQRGIGEVFTEATFVLSDIPDWVKGSRIPDVMFVSAAKMAAYRLQTPDYRSKPYILIPDLVVEVVSPTDNYTDINKRVARYLSDGVRLVWVVDPQLQTIVVHVAGSNQQTTLTGEMLLTGGDVLPDFSVMVREIFGA